MSYNTGLWGETRLGVGAFYFDSPISVSAYSNKDLAFVNNVLTFSAISAYDGILNPLYIVNNIFDFKNGITSSTSLSSVQYAYSQDGTYSNVGVTIYVRNGSVVIGTDSDLDLVIRINPLPSISYTGILSANQEITFHDDNGYFYFTNTVVSADWNFGDGYTSSTTDLTATLVHSYSAQGNYTVSITAYDISGNQGIDSVNITLFESSSGVAKEDYITICGPDMLGRFGSCRLINLRDYLPLYLRDGETEKFLILFEDFLNNMFDGMCGWETSSTELTVNQDWTVSNSATVSADVKINSSYDLCGTNTLTSATNVEQIELHWPTNTSYPTSAQKISILEKIARLTELHDPDLIDIEYIQFFAANLGYNVSISRDEVGVSGDGTTTSFGLTEYDGVCSAADINHYLRFVISNLPNWYKIKTTRNAIKVMLYSFGLVGDIIEYFTEDYKPEILGGKWRLDYNRDFVEIPRNYYPTPHFAILINLDTSSDISFDVSRRDKVIRAIESIRPINTVFRKLAGYFQRTFTISVNMWMRMTRYIKIESNGFANSWWDGSSL